MEEQAAIRLVVAAGCAGALILARWRHQRVRSLGTSDGRSRPVGLPPGRVTASIYWLGLTASAALAGQALASLVVP